MVQDTKALNRCSVLTQLLCSRPTSRKQIAKATGISAATVSRAVAQLIEEQVVREVEEVVVADLRGRRELLLDVAAERECVVGVDLGTSNTRVLVTDLVGSPLRLHREATPKELQAAQLASWVAQTTIQVVGNYLDSANRVVLVLPGAVGQDQTISNAPNLPQLEDALFLKTLMRHITKPVLLENDANSALLGELSFGAAQGASTAAMLSLGSGLGTGIAIDGQLLRGRHGVVGEFGQLPVGPLGARLEELVTEPFLRRRAADTGVPLESIAELFAASPPARLRDLRHGFDQALLIVLSAIVVSCEPEMVVLGGRMARSIYPQLDTYQRDLEQMLRVAPVLVPAALGQYSGVCGAIVLGLCQSYEDLGVVEPRLHQLPAPGTLSLALLEQV